MAPIDRSLACVHFGAATDAAYGDVLSAHLPTVRAVVSSLARKHRLRSDAQQDLLGEVLLRLVHDDYAALRRFRGEAALTTYLFIVARRVLLDQHTKEWGKWRPSRRCRSLGKAAERLERLIRRDRLPWQEAVAIVSHAPDLECTFDTAIHLSRQIHRPARPSLVPLEPYHLHSVRVRPHDPLEHRDAQTELRKVREAILHAWRRLPAPDRRLLAERFNRGRSVADIARDRGEDQKALYRRFERICAQLRQLLLADGTSITDVRALQSRS